MTYGMEAAADIRSAAPEFDTSATRFRLETPSGGAMVRLQVPGRGMVNAALAAAAVGLAAGLEVEQIATGISGWRGAPGRMESIDEGQPFRVIVDFAHAPDSLARVLEELRGSSRGRLIAVFGCIGERERDRRAAMGEVAARMADYTIVTDDNPYTEDRMAIIDGIVSGLERAGRRRGHDFDVVPDRREAIAQAIGMAVDEDVVLLAGKGHETTVHLSDGVYECDDRVVARAELRKPGQSRAS
jgi:UDP-N-acetylmuramoyl-L-alanyl-D-glutamate--2,6-diaminopimelate ligase